MTVFSVLRYPVSYPPTREELENIPRHVFTKWKREIGLGRMPNVGPASMYQRFQAMATRPPEFNPWEEELDILREMIGRMRT